MLGEEIVYPASRLRLPVESADMSDGFAPLLDGGRTWMMEPWPLALNSREWVRCQVLTTGLWFVALDPLDGTA